MDWDESIKHLLDGIGRRRWTPSEIHLDISMRGRDSLSGMARKYLWDRSQLRKLLCTWDDLAICLDSRICPTQSPTKSPSLTDDVERTSPVPCPTKSPTQYPTPPEFHPYSTSTYREALDTGTSSTECTPTLEGGGTLGPECPPPQGSTQISPRSIWGDVSESAPPKSKRTVKSGTVTVYLGRHMRRVLPEVREVIEVYSEWRLRVLGKAYRPVKIFKEVRAARELASQLNLAELPALLKQIEGYVSQPRHRYLEQWVRSLSTLSENYEKLEAWRPFDKKQSKRREDESLTPEQRERHRLQSMSKAEKKRYWDAMISGGSDEG